MAETFVEQFLGPLSDVGATGATSAEERRRPGSVTRLGQAPADVGKRNRHLLLRELLHQLPQLVTLGAHDRQPTAVHLGILLAALIASSQRSAPTRNLPAPDTSGQTRWS